MAHPGGRPLKFSSPQEITDAAEKFFAECKANREPITVTGLCIALGTFRNVLMDYEDERGPEFSNAVKSAKIKCEQYAEKVALNKGHAGAIFCLKNYGWTDKQDINLGGQKDNPVQTINYSWAGDEPNQEPRQ